MRPTVCEQIASWATAARWDRIPHGARERIKLHLLDAVGCAIGALDAEPIVAIRTEATASQIGGPCRQIAGPPTSPERAAFYNGALVRYLDFMDTFIAPGEACHPSDNVAAVLAGADLAQASGKDLLRALLVAYHTQCRITASGAPIMRSGFDHTIQLAISQAAGLSCVLGLTPKQAAHAVAISAAQGLGLAQSRAGTPVPQWKGLAAAATAFSTVHNTLMAQSGITGPLDAIEGPLGLEQLLGRKLKIDWKHQRCDAVLDCSIKRYNAEFHAQSCIDGLLGLRHKHAIDPGQIRSIEIEIFKVAHEMIGGGKYVDPKAVSTKEDADHSLHYLAAVALLDGAVGPAQFEPSRIQADDVQSLLRKVSVSPNFWYTRAYPKKMLCEIKVILRNGQRIETRVDDYSGFYRRPMSTEDVLDKFESLTRGRLPDGHRKEIAGCVLNLEDRPAPELLDLLAAIPRSDTSRAAAD